jgi:uncharacterized protein (TIGR02246 family)
LLRATVIVGRGRTQQTDDERAIRDRLVGFSPIWEKADINAFERLLTEDAEWVTRTGTYLKGRPDVVAHHARMLTDTFKGSRVVWTPLNVRLLRPDVAVAHVAAQLTVPDGTQRPSGMVTVVLVKRDIKWLITAVQNTDRSSRAIEDEVNNQ